MRTLTVAAGAVAVAAATLVPAVPVAAGTTTIAPGNVAVSLHRVASGFSSPTYVTSAHDGTGRLFVVEQGGTVRVYRSGVIQSRVYLNITSRVACCGEQGLLSIAFHPNFRRHPYVYVAYTRASDGALQISRFRASSYTATHVSASTEVRFLAVPHPNQTNHNAGQLLFDKNGLFYITTGDGGGAGDPYHNAENLRSLSGKVLRIDVDHRCGGTHYCIPANNPFPHATNTNKRLVFDWGLRNPWRASIDRGDGTLWIGDVGQSAWEEVDHTNTRGGGKDFGWSCREALSTYNSAECPGRTMTNPVTEYDHSNNRQAIIGGYAYHGPRYTFAAGLYVFADWMSGEIWALGRTSTGGYRRAKVGQFSGNITGFGETGAGEIYAVSGSGGLYHLTFRRV